MSGWCGSGTRIPLGMTTKASADALRWGEGLRFPTHRAKCGGMNGPPGLLFRGEFFYGYCVGVGTGGEHGDEGGFGALGADDGDVSGAGVCDQEKVLVG
jgi:hypothetical protein